MKNRTNNSTAAKTMIEMLEDRMCLSGDPHIGGMLVGMGDGSVRTVSSTVQITDGTSYLKTSGGTTNTLIGLLLPAV
jgi:hypothetical protein